MRALMIYSPLNWIHQLETKPSTREPSGGLLHIKIITYYPLPLKGSCLFHNAKCIQFIFKNPQILKSFNVVQKFNCNVSKRTQGKLLNMVLKLKSYIFPRYNVAEQTFLL